jgi:N6-L-threonylcarbamoyladenine synthase
MRILGVETSCDETGAAVIEASLGDRKVTLLSNVVSSSLSLHAKTGGIIPEVAAREQVKCIIPVIKKALREAKVPHTVVTGLTIPQINAIDVTVGPGLIGSLLVGVETAKTLSSIWDKPIIPVNHLIGHIYANYIAIQNGQSREVSFPALALIVSGGHTDLVLMLNNKQTTWIGGTRDDAAGEAFDKIGRLLHLPYPAGPLIAKLATKGNQKAFTFPRPMVNSDDFDFSFSGLKTAVLREVKKTRSGVNDKLTVDISASVQQAIVDTLVAKTVNAAKKYNVKSILLSGGVGANDLLRKELARKSEPKVKFFAPPKNLCTDNAAMIAAAAYFYYKPVPWQKIYTNPNLHF